MIFLLQIICHLTSHDNNNASASIDHFNPEEKESLVCLCQSYSNVSHLPGASLTYTTTLCHEIKAIVCTPIFSKIYRFPKIHEAEVDSQMQKMLQQKIMKPSIRPYSSSLWVTEKKKNFSSKRK